MPSRKRTRSGRRKRSRSRIPTPFRRRSRGRKVGTAVTFQKDGAQTFRAGRVPRAKLMFQRAVVNAMSDRNPPAYFHFTETGTKSGPAVDTQLWLPFFINSWFGAPTVVGTDDVVNMARQLQPSTTGLVGNELAYMQAYLKSCRMNIEIRNVTNTDPGPELIVDIFELVCRRDCPYESFADMESCASEYWDRVGGNTALYPATVGVSPFQLPKLTRYFKIKGCKRIRLGSNDSANDSFEFSTGWKGNYKFKPFETATGNNNILARRGLTKLYLFRIIGSLDASGGRYLPAVSYSCTKLYNLKVLNQIPQTAQVPNTTT